MRALLVTGADEHFAPLLRDLIRSLANTKVADLAVLDLGLGPETLSWVASRAKHVIAPGWDLPVSAHVRNTQPYHRALTARPFLRDYFPGYDVYVWIDADCWVQELKALDGYIAAARRGALAITPQQHPAYRHDATSRRWRAQRLKAYYGSAAVLASEKAPYVNAGVFALPSNAPHWSVWRHCFERGLVATRGGLVCDQTALNYLLLTQRLPTVFLHATYNWLCHLALPALEERTRRFCEPTPSARLLYIVHLTAGTKALETLRFWQF